jgi:hypothetical protein
MCSDICPYSISQIKLAADYQKYLSVLEISKTVRSREIFDSFLNCG